jgi:hypothetical protein
MKLEAISASEPGHVQGAPQFMCLGGEGFGTWRRRPRQARRTRTANSEQRTANSEQRTANSEQRTTNSGDEQVCEPNTAAAKSRVLQVIGTSPLQLLALGLLYCG